MSVRVLSIGATAVGTLTLIAVMLQDFSLLFPWWIPIVAFLAVGALLTWRIPSNRIGWLLLLFGVVGALGGAGQTLAVALGRSAGWFDAIGYLFNTSVIVYTLAGTLLRFPTGQLLNPRWRWAELLAIVAATCGGLAALFNGGWGGDINQAVIESPLRESTAPLGDILSALFFPLMAISFVFAGGSVIVRYRRSEGDERLQMKWLAYAGGFLIAMLVMTTVVSLFQGELQVALTGGLAVVGAVSFALIPVAIAVAILRYRLYDIDVVISRTVVLAVLAVFITGTYALIVVGIGAAIGGESEGLLLPIVATALVATAFEPVRLRAQHWANRLVYGNRATPYEVLSDLASRLSAADDQGVLLDRMASLLREGTGSDRATIWLGAPGQMDPGASSPSGVAGGSEPAMDGVSSFPVEHDGEVVGALEVIKPKGTALSTAEKSLISDLVGSAGAVVGYQRLNRSLAERAVELEASRLRLVEAQDQERRRLERELHEGAEQYIVALKVKLGVATQLANRHGASDLGRMLGGLADEAQAALDDVRSLAKGIYPQLLESDGLGAAVSALAASTPVEVTVQREGVGRYPIDIEAAVYFDISEAVTNAVKHAEAPIGIQLGQANGALEFSVVDSGPGFDLDQLEKGSGLENMADRMSAVGGTLTVRSSVGGRTEVVGSVPLAEARDARGLQAVSD